MRSLRPILFLAVMALFVQPLTGCSDDNDDSQPDVADDAGDTGDDGDAGDDGSDAKDAGTDAADASGGDDADATGGDDADATDGDDADATDGDDADASEESDAADGSESGLPQTCEGDCLETILTLEYAGETGVLTRAGFGLTAPNITDSGEWEVHMEVWEGGVDGCPVENSPTPDWQFNITGFEIPQDDTPLTKVDDGVFLTLLDFDGKFLGYGPPGRADVIALTPVAMRIDTDIVASGQQDEEGFIALDVAAAFGEDGNTSGHIYAKHCVSMDLLQ